VSVNRLATVEHDGTAVRFDPNARAFEAFAFGGRGTSLLDPVQATTLDAALAEVTERHSGLDRGSRIGFRELGEGIDKLHIYAVRRTGIITATRPAYDNPLRRVALDYKKRLEHICTVDLRTVAGLPPEFDCNPSLAAYQRREHDDREARRPAGARKTEERK